MKTCVSYIIVNHSTLQVLTNWYERRKKDTAYGPRRNSISNLFFQQEKKQSSPVAGLRGGGKLRGSMLNLEEILAGEGVGCRQPVVMWCAHTDKAGIYACVVQCARTRGTLGSVGMA